MKTEEYKVIGEIDFHDTKVKVYYHPEYNDKLNDAGCVWQMRNPDSCYEGNMYMDFETGECSYPEGVVIPEQTDKDREILPKFIIVGKQKLDENEVKAIKKHLELRCIRKNKIITTQI